MYNIKINTLPVLTKLFYKMVNKHEPLVLTSKEDIQLKKEIEKNKGKLVAISVYHNDYEEFMSYIGNFTYDVTDNAKTYLIPLVFQYSHTERVNQTVYYLQYNTNTKTLSFNEF